jgi:putative CocE/NonD family hydrolase
MTIGVRLAPRHCKSCCVGLLACWLSIASAQDSPPRGPFAFDMQPNVFITMRDGVRLATDLYIPKGKASERYPIVLIRTPYGHYPPSHYLDVPIAVFASHGYIVAVQDTRGKGRSEGVFLASGGDANDGYDAIQWLGGQAWSNGNVGTYGCSYMGDVQIYAAQTRPPALKAMIPEASGSAAGSIQGLYRYFGERIGSVNEWAAAVGWFAKNGAKVVPRLPTTLDSAEYTALYTPYNRPPKPPVVDYQRAWRHLPMVDALHDQGFPQSDFADNISKKAGDPYWSQLPYMTDSYTSDVPALFVNSWYDFGAEVTMFEYNWFKTHSLSQKARDNQFVIIGPGTHCAWEELPPQPDRFVGSRFIGDSHFDYWNAFLTWFDYWLKGNTQARRTIDSWPRLRYYEMGLNAWQSADAWPIKSTSQLQLYLGSHGRANSLQGNGVLMHSVTPAGSAEDQYIYDPENPVPSLGGAMCCTGTTEALAGSMDQRPVEAREDVLVYTTEPLKSSIAITGIAQVTLFVSSNAVDTDFTAKLVDVYPDGRAFNVLEGILRARDRQGADHEVWMEKDKIYAIHISLGATSNLFDVGHRIRVEVSSSNFPRFDRNLNVGGDNSLATRWVSATNHVYHSSKYPSHLTLPQIAQVPPG